MILKSYGKYVTKLFQDSWYTIKSYDPIQIYTNHMYFNTHDTFYHSTLHNNTPSYIVFPCMTGSVIQSLNDNFRYTTQLHQQQVRIYRSLENFRPDLFRCKIFSSK